MRFALLGADSELLALADAAVAAGHAIAWRENPANPQSWEELLDSETADAVLVGSGSAPDAKPDSSASDDRARQVQELAKQGQPLLTTHPVVPSVISYFEIDMARGESGAVLQHFNPLVESPHVAELALWARDGHPQWGPVEQIVATRRPGDRSREHVMWHFARDVELLARLAGRLDRIAAHGVAGESDAAYASLSVQLHGPQQVPVRWSVEPVVTEPELTVALVFARGRATLAFDPDGRVAELAVRSVDGATSLAHLAEGDLPSAHAQSPAGAAVARFVAAVAAADGAATTWPSALDAMELADSIEISLRRGRMIDVHHRELTEQLAFKGVMSALGCGVLVVVIPLLMFVGWIAGLFQAPLSEYWPHALLLLLAGFLGLQLLPKLILPKERRESEGASGRVTKSSSEQVNSTD